MIKEFIKKMQFWKNKPEQGNLIKKKVRYQNTKKPKKQKRLSKRSTIKYLVKSKDVTEQKKN